MDKSERRSILLYHRYIFAKSSNRTLEDLAAMELLNCGNPNYKCLLLVNDKMMNNLALGSPKPVACALHPSNN